MTSLFFDEPEPPRPDPTLERARREEEERARRGRISEAQEQLSFETRLRGRRGIASLLGGGGLTQLLGSG